MGLTMCRAPRTCSTIKLEDPLLLQCWVFPLSSLLHTPLSLLPLSRQILTSASWACTPVGKIPPVQTQREATPACVPAVCLNPGAFAPVGWWVTRSKGRNLVGGNAVPPCVGIRDSRQHLVPPGCPVCFPDQVGAGLENAQWSVF